MNLKELMRFFALYFACKTNETTIGNMLSALRIDGKIKTLGFGTWIRV